MNADTAYSTLGPCEDHEFDLAEFVDGTLDAARHASLKRHLDACARCRAFVHDFAAVHASLAQALPRVELSPDFDARLEARIAALARAPGKEAARARAEQEYRGAIASLRKGLTWSAALDAVAAASACGGLVTVVMTLAPRLMQALDVAHLPPGMLGLGIGGLAVLAGLSVTIGLARRPSLSLTG